MDVMLIIRQIPPHTISVAPDELFHKPALFFDGALCLSSFRLMVVISLPFGIIVGEITFWYIIKIVLDKLEIIF